MSVVGIGTDIIDVTRIVKMKEGAREKLAQRILTPNELTRYRELNYSAAFLAKRWAAKEAASKALGRGIADGLSFQHFEISSLATGQPVLTLTHRALVIAKGLGANSWHISIADEKKYATAFVVLSQ